MNALFSIFAVVTTGVLVSTILFGTPIWLLVSGYGRLASGRNGAIRLTLGGVWVLVLLILGAWIADGFSSRHEQILDKGFTPDGREYCLIQRRGGEPYQVELFVRDKSGDWVFHYIDHEIWPWRSGHLDFSDDTVRVFHGDRPHCPVTLKPPDDPTTYKARFAASVTPEEILAGAEEKP